MDMISKKVTLSHTELFSNNILITFADCLNFKFIGLLCEGHPIKNETFFIV